MHSTPDITLPTQHTQWRSASMHAYSLDILAALPLCKSARVHMAASAWRGETFEKIRGPCGDSIRPVSCCCGRDGGGRGAASPYEVEEGPSIYFSYPLFF